jgi:hypothetical protein
VVQQLRERPYYLFLYLDALFKKDPELPSEFADLQVSSFSRYEFEVVSMRIYRLRSSPNLQHIV